MPREKFFYLTKLEWVLFIFLFLAYGFFLNEYPGWNANTRVDLVFAVVDQGKLNIDAYWDNQSYGNEYHTQDVAFYKGHHYCDKSPITSLLGVPVYWFFGTLADLFSIPLPPDIGRYLITLFVISLPSAILAVLLYRFLGLIRQNPREQLVITLFYSLGTIAFPYSILFFSHQIAAFFVFLGFYFLYKFLKQDADISASQYWFWLFISGISIGLGFAVEQTVGIAVGVITCYLFSQLKQKRLIFWYFLGIGIPLLLLMFYNEACFGSPWSLGYQYEILELFSTNMSRGLMGITYPSWQALWGITLSPYRGLFFLSPFLLFIIPGFFGLIREKKSRPEGVSILCIMVGFIYFNISYYAWYGGWGIGPRHIIPMIPFLMIPLYKVYPRFSKWIIFFGFLSILHLSLICITEPQVPWDIPFPLIQFTWPRFTHLIFTQNILTVFLKMSRLYAVVLWVIFLIVGIVVLFRISSIGHSPKKLVDN